MQLKRNKYQDIEKELLKAKTAVQNFSKAIDFPFLEIYKNIVMQIKTAEISADCILYNSFESFNETKEFVNKSFWCFSGDGQGNRWLFDKAGMVFYYDHDYDEGFDAMEINFEQWLQMADLSKQLDDYIENERMTDTIRNEFHNLLKQIHPNLSEKYPFLI